MTALILRLCFDSTFYGLEKSAAVADKFFLSEIQYSEFSISPLYLIGKIQCYDRSLNQYFLLYQWIAKGSRNNQNRRLDCRLKACSFTRFMSPVLTFILMHEEIEKIHHAAFLSLCRVHLLALALQWSEVKIKLVKFWSPAGKKKTKKNGGLLVKYSSEVWNSGLNSCPPYRIPMDGWANQLSSGSWSWTPFPCINPGKFQALCVHLPNKQSIKIMHTLNSPWLSLKHCLLLNSVKHYSIQVPRQHSCCSKTLVEALWPLKMWLKNEM